MHDQVTNIRLAGVGGQGILVASEVLCDALLASGHDVKKSETHGMAQRGGAVNSDIRFGPKVHSPLNPQGAVDLLVAFEEMEALRYLPSLKEGGTTLVNRQRILPVAVASGKAEYPSDVVARLAQHAARVVSLDALALAVEAGAIRSVNICLLGALSCFLPVPEETWRTVLTDRFRNKGLEANLRAFALGRAAAQAEGGR
ncbi:MAG: indolepyruvate oxidoreductase subunit beta [Armatimonadetes bacterium]|jgi:indolepyruvate ferredoxin oxidoreductase beta subunit|nr:indolepyruvate oxidoreductase subunit beta [Armatimonadota bacterium]